MMTEPKFWKDLAARFRALGTPGNREPLGAEWCAGGWPEGYGEWYLRGGNSETERDHFRALARIAAVALGHSGGDNAWQAWLNLIKQASPHFRAGGRADTRMKGVPKVISVETGIMPDVWEASASYCLQCEADAFEAASRACELESKVASAGLASIVVPPNSPDCPEPPLASSPRRQRVDEFLAECLRETSIRVTKTHIWRLAGHKRSRQFAHWQAGTDRLPQQRHGATGRDDVNFRRVLSMTPSEFVEALRARGLI